MLALLFVIYDRFSILLLLFTKLLLWLFDNYYSLSEINNSSCYYVIIDYPEKNPGICYLLNID